MEILRPQLGGDPEFFIYRNKDNKLKIVTADKAIPYPKANPAVAYAKNGEGDDLYPEGKYHFDGVQAEINPNSHFCRDSHLSSTKLCLQRVYEDACKRLKEASLTFAPLASISVTKEDIRGTDLECRRFGCSPDMNIYTKDKIKYPDGNKFMTRFSGGHIHIGFFHSIYSEVMQQPNKILSLIKALDYIPGLLSVAISPGEEEKTRREWYGKAGTYRMQRHGLEYRTLSSYWLISPPLASLAYGLSRDAFAIVYLNHEDELFKLVSNEEVIRIINEVDAKGARDIYFNIYKPYFEKFRNGDDYLIYNSPFNLTTQEVFDKIVKKSYKAYFDPLKTTNYWRLTTNADTGSYGISKFTDDVVLLGEKEAINRMES